jgi:8-oxo-dGTP pyrophosphatase MutT (NUDIX family)
MSDYPSPALLRVAAGALIRDPDGRVLLVHPCGREWWEIPGGVVEDGESPPEAAARELREELGIALAVGRLLVVDYVSARDGHNGLLNFVFDAPVVASDTTFDLPPDELDQATWVAAKHLEHYLIPRMADRVHASLDAAHRTNAHYLDTGRAVGTASMP